jgi:hypothetical protein
LADSPFPEFHHPAPIRARRYNADHAGDVVIEFLANGQQTSPIFGAGDDAIAAEFAAENLDLGLEESDARVTPGGAGFN